MTSKLIFNFITTLRTARKARMKTQRHIWSVTLAGCLMDTMDQRERKNKDEKRTCGKKAVYFKKAKKLQIDCSGYH